MLKVYLGLRENETSTWNKSPPSATEYTKSTFITGQLLNLKLLKILSAGRSYHVYVPCYCSS